MTPLWTSDDAARATGGETTSEWEAYSVSIDTRTLEPGALFVALTDQRDGHDFVADAFAKGAAAALVSRIPEGVPPDAPLLQVPEVLPALEALALAARSRTKAQIVGITGSVGKTTTKEMLRTALMDQGRTHAAERSYNNHWGVPLTLARMPADADYAVIEIGMNAPGEIAPLARMAHLDVAVITTVAPAHLAAFGSVAEIAREKASIVDGLRESGAAVLNADIDTSAILMERAAVGGARCLGFGRTEGLAARLVSAAVEGTQTHVAIDLGVPLTLTLNTPGVHFAMNALAALAVVQALGADPAQAARTLDGWQPTDGRGARHRVQLSEGSFDLIDDAYNANPASMGAALSMLAALTPVDDVGAVSRGRRVAVLGDMLELGETELALHAALAEVPDMVAIDRVHCVGPLSRALWEALPAAKRGLWAETSEALVSEAATIADAGDIILVKGSLGSRLAPVVSALRDLGAPPETRV